MNGIRFLLVSMLITMMSMTSAAQESDPATDGVNTGNELLEALEEAPFNEKDAQGPGSGSADTDDRRIRFTILAGPGYTPEMGFVLGGGFLMSWFAGEDPARVTRSSMPVMFTVATVGGYSLTFRKKSYWLEDNLRWNTDLRIRDLNDNYWGVGYEAGRSTEKGADTAYRRFWWEFRPETLWQILPNFFVGVLWDINQTIASDVNSTMAADPDFLAYGDNNLNSGPGATVLFDTRDFPQNAWSGLLIETSAVFYSEYFGGQNDYQVLTIDYRQYRTLWRDGTVLAWQIYTEGRWGEVPWDSMSRLGSVFDLRGYYDGRYRDKMVAWVLVEYRHTFTRRDGDLSKHGFVAWAGLGTLGPGYTSLEGVLPNLGVGYRFEVQPRLNVRFDIGWGMDTFGVYFNFQEAF